MPVFAIFEVSAPEFIREHLQQSYPDAHLEVSSRTFLVADRLTTSVQLGEKLGLSDTEPRSRAIIVPVTSYWGYHNRSIWEWISAKRAEYGHGT